MSQRALWLFNLGIRHAEPWRLRPERRELAPWHKTQEGSPGFRNKAIFLSFVTPAYTLQCSVNLNGSSAMVSYHSARHAVSWKSPQTDTALSGKPTQAASIYDIPCSPASGSINADKQSFSRNRNRSPTAGPGAIAQSLHKSTPSSTRKRRLPVHELALLRTTTCDGLPQPSVRSLHVFHR